MEGASGQICRHTLSLEPLGDNPATTLMAGYMAFRAERCDMQAFTLAVCLSHAHLHTHTHSPRGLPLITADLCTFRLWNDSRADQRTTSRFASRLILFPLTLSESSLHLPIIDHSLSVTVCLLLLHQSVCCTVNSSGGKGLHPQERTFLLPTA